MSYNKSNIQNVLIIDDASSISYQHTGISTKTDVPVIDDINILFDEFKRHEDIFAYDTEKCINLILADDSEIPLYKYQNQPIRFLKISTSELKEHDNDIIIRLGDNDHQYIIKNISWQNISKQVQPLLPPYNIMRPNEEIEEVSNDFDGYLNCLYILKTVKALKLNGIDAIKIDAVQKSTDLSVITEHAEYLGYLPSIGQLAIIDKYQPMLNYIVRQIGKTIPDLSNGIWWSSNEYNANFSWYFKNHAPQHGIFSKNFNGNVLTLFKKAQ